MRRRIVCSVTMLTVLACAGVGACSSSSSTATVDASTSSDDGGASGVTCYNLVAAGTVTVASADACRVLGSGHPGVMLPAPVPAGLVVSNVCSELCASVHGDNFCVVEASYASAYELANTQGGATDGGAEAGTVEAGTTACPGAPDAGGVSITCYAEMPYQATACPQ